MAKKKETQGGADKKAGKQKEKTAKKDQKAPKPMAEKREPRLQKHYRDNVRPALQEQFGFENPHQIPVIEKVVVNVGIGEAPKNQKLLDSVVEELTIITGQKPVINRSRKSK